MQAQKNRKAEKHKEELRRLALLPGNKVCANCPVRGPLYAVIDYNIFVCTQCSAIHRSLQHKVKGISMSEFTDEEVAGMRVGGNERAASIWRVGYPYGTPKEGDERAIRNSICQCFVERRYFNANEHERMQNEQVQASLPPVTGLPSGVTLHAPHTVHQPVTTPTSTAQTAQAANSISSAPTSAPTSAATPIHQGRVVSAAPMQTSTSSIPTQAQQQPTFATQSAPVATQAKSAGVDDFFSGPSHSTLAPKSVPQGAHTGGELDFFSGSTASPSSQRVGDSALMGGDFFGGSTASVPAATTSTSYPSHTVNTVPTGQRVSQQATIGGDLDFFGGFTASTTSSSSTAAAGMQRQPHTTGNTDDFFGGGGGFNTTQQQQPQYQQNANFFAAPSAPTRQPAAPLSLNSAGGGNAKKVDDPFASLYSFK